MARSGTDNEQATMTD